MNAKTIGLTVLGIVLLAGGAGVVLNLGYFGWGGKTQPIRLTLAGSSPGEFAGLEKELKEFGQLYPEYAVDLQVLAPNELSALVSGPPSGLPDVFMLSDPGVLPPDRYASPPVVWTGSGWNLYYNKLALRKVGIDPESLAPADLVQLPELSDLARMEATFDRLLAAGVVPISLGSQYGWPEGAWLQHLEAFLDGPAAAAALASGKEPQEAAAWGPASQVLSRWKAKGYINKDWNTLDWPQSVLNWAAGKAAFILLDEGLIGTVPASQRPAIGRLDFPVGTHGAWKVGSVWYLAAPQSAGAEKGRLLFRYLTSQGVTQRLSSAEGRTYFSLNTGLFLVPSVTAATGSPFIDSLKSR